MNAVLKRAAVLLSVLLQLAVHVVWCRLLVAAQADVKFSVLDLRNLELVQRVTHSSKWLKVKSSLNDFL